MPDDKDRVKRGYLSYATLYPAFTKLVRSAMVGAAELEPEERFEARRASLHWLRHTHATRVAEAGVPSDVLQANLGQADPRTTARYYRAQARRHQEHMEGVFGGSTPA